MILSNKIFNSITFGMLSVVFLTSCSSYRNVNSTPDGIYGTKVPSETRKSVSNANDMQRNANQESETYTRFFQDQGEMISEARQANSEVFVNIEEYSSDDGNYTEEEKYYGEPLYNGNNPAWGSNPTSVSVNYINTGFGPGWGWGWGGFGFGNPYFGGLYGPGWGWGGFGGGFYGPGFGVGSPFIGGLYGGFGGFYGGFGGFYGPGFYGPGIGYPFYSGYGGFYDLAHTRTHRFSQNRSYTRSQIDNRYANKGRSNVTRASAVRSNAAGRYGRKSSENVSRGSRSNSSAYSNRVRNSRNIGVRTSGNYSRAGIRNTEGVDARTRSNSTYRNTSSRTRSYNPSSTSNRSSGVRSSSRTTRSSSARSSGRSSRSSGVRSSGGSSRSSGGRSSGGRSSGRR